MKNKLLQEVDVLALSSRTISMLKRSGIKYIFQLVNLEINNLGDIQWIGGKLQSEIVRAVHNMGLKFREELEANDVRELDAIINEISNREYEIKYIDDISIDQLPLMVRAPYCLKRENINWLSELIKCDLLTLSKIKYLGAAELDSIIKTVHEKGLLFRGEVPDSVIITEVRERSINLKDSILALGLDSYHNTALYNCNILYVYQLLKLKTTNLSRLKGIGNISADEIVKKVHNLGLKFMDEMNSEEKRAFIHKIQEKSSKEVIYIDDALIETLDLSMRSYHALIRANIMCVSQLIEHTIPELMRVRNLGEISVQEVVSKVHELGLFFEGESLVDSEVIVEIKESDCVYSTTKSLEAENDKIQSRTELKADLIRRYKEAKNRNESLRRTDQQLDQILLQILMIEGYDVSKEKGEQNSEQRAKRNIKAIK